MPTIRNITRENTIANEARLCSNSLSKAIGLMFSKSGKALIFTFKTERIVPLHMLFVFFPIDVLFLDKNKRVVEMKENFRPFALHTPKKPCLHIIEAPAGTIRRTKTAVGDRIRF